MGRVDELWLKIPHSEGDRLPRPGRPHDRLDLALKEGLRGGLGAEAGGQGGEIFGEVIRARAQAGVTGRAAVRVGRLIAGRCSLVAPGNASAARPP
jgi:hypothetical protein